MIQSHWLYPQTVKIPASELDPPPPPLEVYQFFRLPNQPYLTPKVPFLAPWSPPITPDMMTVAPDPEVCGWFRLPNQPRIDGPVRYQPGPAPIHPIWFATWTKYYLDASGCYRVFGPAVYRMYWGNSIPAEGDTPDATSATLPYTTTPTFADGTWYFSMSYFNGVVDSGFLPVGDHGETYQVLVIAGGDADATPPPGPQSWRIEQRAGGVVRVIGILYSTGTNAPDKWAIAYTDDGTTPAEDSPDVSVVLAQNSLAVLSYDLPAQSHGTVLKVRLQTCRNDGTDSVPVWVYSDGSTVKSITIDTAGPAAPPSGDRWAGSLPEEF